MEDSRKWKIKPPKGLADYIRKNCAENNYIIFSEKLGKAVCTHCNEEFDFRELGMWFAHSKDARLTVTCPICGERAIPKDARYGRKSLQDEGRIIWFRGIGGVTFMEMDDFIIDYRMPHPEIWVASAQQIRLAKGSQIRLDFEKGWWKEDEWVQVGAIRVKHPRTQMYGARKEHTHVMWETMDNLGTDLKYADASEDRFRNIMMFDEYGEAQALIKYMSDFLKYPAIELLEKAGFETLVMNRAYGRRTSAINIRGTTLRKILRLNGAEVRYLSKMDPTMEFIDDIRMIRKKWPQAKIEDIEDLAKLFPRFIDKRRMKKIERHARWDKVMRLLMEDNRRTGALMTISDYSDYLGWVMQMGLRRDKRTIYPKDFLAAHDELMFKVKEDKGRSLLQAFLMAEKEITGMDGPFVADGIMIRPAKSPEELRKESLILNHCVRTYVDRVARGDTAILFVRREEDPEQPWFTLELNPEGRIIQCRGKHNCGYPDEVEVFLEKWQKWRSKQRIAA